MLQDVSTRGLTYDQMREAFSQALRERAQDEESEIAAAVADEEESTRQAAEEQHQARAAQYDPEPEAPAEKVVASEEGPHRPPTTPADTKEVEKAAANWGANDSDEDDEDSPAQEREDESPDLREEAATNPKHDAGRERRDYNNPRKNRGKREHRPERVEGRGGRGRGERRGRGRGFDGRGRGRGQLPPWKVREMRQQEQEKRELIDDGWNVEEKRTIKKTYKPRKQRPAPKKDEE